MTLIKKYLWGAAYGFLGNLALALLHGATVSPTGNVVDVYLWQGLGVAAFTGLAKALKFLAAKLVSPPPARPR